MSRDDGVTGLLEALAAASPDVCFVEIGVSRDGPSGSLRDLADRHGWRGVVVDPLPSVQARLREEHGGSSRISLEQAAIGARDEQRPFFSVETGSGDGKGALQREVLFFPQNHFPGIEDHIAESQTISLTFESLIRRHGLERVDVLRIDTAGDEAEILAQVDLDRFRPVLIVHSHASLPRGVRDGCLQRLEAAGYETLELAEETRSYNEGALSGRPSAELTQEWKSLRNAWRQDQRLARARSLGSATRRRLGRGIGGTDGAPALPLSDAERHYLTAGYDDRVPLDAEAAAYLSRDNPRLLELRRTYEVLGLPATDHVVWAPEEVSRVDLRYFRGDNLYLWHYPEHPRAMELKFFVYMKYLLDRGGQSLLDQLAEDGAFGAWTLDIRGHGRLSRDLLDSANEILFLDRELNVLDGECPRVLDIGAGYGRLAYRMSEAVPGLQDYCCVDAIPESTFLCEYYLGYRGVTPPARAVPLHGVSDLEPGSFDLAVNVHSFSECTLEVIRWWVGELKRLRVPSLFVVPNEADGLLSKEHDGSYRSALPVLETAGYRQVAKERAIADPAIRDLTGLNDNFYLFSLAEATDSGQVRDA